MGLHPSSRSRALTGLEWTGMPLLDSSTDQKLLLINPASCHALIQIHAFLVVPRQTPSPISYNLSGAEAGHVIRHRRSRPGYQVADQTCALGIAREIAQTKSAETARVASLEKCVLRQLVVPCDLAPERSVGHRSRSYLCRQGFGGGDRFPPIAQEPACAGISQRLPVRCPSSVRPMVPQRTRLILCKYRNS